MSAPAVRWLGRKAYEDVWAEMRTFTDRRTPSDADEIWFVEHPPVFTLGTRTDPSHLLAPGDIPIVQTDRGGQVTYHGPGQLVAYVLLDLKRLGLGIRALVQALEQALIDTLAPHGVEAAARREAPGVYVEGKKVAALGLRVRRHCTYHGMAINVAMDLEPFRRIRPCGFADLEVTQLRDLCGIDTLDALRTELEPNLLARLYRGS